MVQSFLVDESTELIHDTGKLDEWKQKCEELGLTQQLELTSENKSPIPFQAMDTVSHRVYETLCPARADYARRLPTIRNVRVKAMDRKSSSVSEEYPGM